MVISVPFVLVVETTVVVSILVAVAVVSVVTFSKQAKSCGKIKQMGI